eukprot:COSAG02_NODE_2025_length_10084_cov_8.514372_6_plen_65_part_00
MSPRSRPSRRKTVVETVIRANPSFGVKELVTLAKQHSSDLSVGAKEVRQMIAELSTVRRTSSCP